MADIYDYLTENYDPQQEGMLEAFMNVIRAERVNRRAQQLESPYQRQGTGLIGMWQRSRRRKKADEMYQQYDQMLAPAMETFGQMAQASQQRKFQEALEFTGGNEGAARMIATGQLSPERFLEEKRLRRGQAMDYFRSGDSQRLASRKQDELERQAGVDERRSGRQQRFDMLRQLRGDTEAERQGQFGRSQTRREQSLAERQQKFNERMARLEQLREMRGGGKSAQATGGTGLERALARGDITQEEFKDKLLGTGDGGGGGGGGRRSQSDAVKASSVQDALVRIDGLKEQLRTEGGTGKFVGRLPEWINWDLETIHADRDALVNSIQALTRIPGIGAQSDFELKQLLKGITNQTESEEWNINNLNQIRKKVQEIARRENWIVDAAPQEGSVGDRVNNYYEQAGDGGG